LESRRTCLNMPVRKSTTLVTMSRSEKKCNRTKEREQVEIFWVMTPRDVAD